MKKVIETALDEIRRMLVIPFIVASDAADTIGWSVVKTEDGQYNLVEDIEGCNWLFPRSLRSEGNELITAMDCIYELTLDNEAFLRRYKDLQVEKELLLADLSNHGTGLVMYASWRMNCSRYLYKLARSASEATELFLRDDHPYYLYGAVMALSYAFWGTINKDVKALVKVLMTAHSLSS